MYRKKELVPFAAALGGNLFMAWLFLNANRFPEKNINFIAASGFLIFLFEFLSIHSSSIIAGLSKSTRAYGLLTNMPAPADKVFLLVTYSIFAFGWGLAFHNWTITIYFTASLLVKLFAQRSYPGNKTILFSILIFLGVTIGVAILQQPLSVMFPLPETPELLQSDETRGFLGITPRVIPIWGVIYFSLMALKDLIFFVGYREKAMA